MADKNRYITLNNGLKMPMIGYGTWQADDNDNEKLKNCLRHAIVESGYRHIDTAKLYEIEEPVGEVLAEVIEGGIPREELFVTTKLQRGCYALEGIEDELKGSLERLKIDYIDLYLVHWTFPELDYESTPLRSKDPPLEKIWEVLEGLVDKGLAKSIGVSNCNAQLLINLLAGCRIPPAVNQIELHPYNKQFELVDFHNKVGVALTAYAPLGNPGFMGEGHVKVIEQPVIKELAEAHSVSTAQICLAYALARGYAAIPKSTTPSRIQQNIDSYDVQLSEEDIKKIDNIDTAHRYYNPRDWIKQFGWDGEAVFY